MNPATPDLAALWDSMELTDLPRFIAPRNAIQRGKSRYAAVEARTGVPWMVIGCLHQRESGGDFTCHLHNGDPLTARTVHVPAGRPIEGNPPFPWEESAVDALHYEGLAGLNWIDLPSTLYRIERFNGLGYRSEGIFSPYLWAGTNHYTYGKFDEDDHFDPSEVDQQPGCAGMLSVLGYGPSSPSVPSFWQRVAAALDRIF